MKDIRKEGEADDESSSDDDSDQELNKEEEQALHGSMLHIIENFN